MRSIPLLAATSVILMLATGCGDDGPTDITPPVANFSQTCTELSCTFDDQSTGSPSGWSWTFGDVNSGAANTSTLENPVHVFTAPGTYQVVLTVTNDDGTNSITKPVTVTTATTNQPPVAGFTAGPCVVNVDCLFSDTSSDDVGVTIWAWDFSDGGTSPEQNPTHRFATAGTFNVTLTVTDAQGATNTITQPVVVSTATTQECVPASPTDVLCTLTVPQTSTVQITLASRDCEIGASRVFTPAPAPPRPQTIFSNVCFSAEPAPYTLIETTGAPIVFQAGSSLRIQFHRGEPDANDPAAGQPAARFEPSSANSWTISIDDGGNVGGVGEPDFADVLLTVTATPQ
jgi:PKD repeat protein